MARTTKQLSGAGKDKFLRGLIASEAGIAVEAADALSAKMSSAIADVRVRREAWEEQRTTLPTAVTEAPTTLATEIEPAPEVFQTTPPAAFDPFAFSALAVLTKKGRAELAKQLSEIDNIDHLHAMAVAQHLGVDADLADLALLREALVAATEARLAERRAAAS